MESTSTGTPPEQRLPPNYAVIVREDPQDSTGVLIYVPAITGIFYGMPACVPVQGAGDRIHAFESYREAAAACRLHFYGRQLGRNFIAEEMMISNQQQKAG